MTEMNRELGAPTYPCGGCGTDLPLETRPDGALATTRCGKCFPDVKPERAAAVQRPERGVVTPDAKSDEKGDE